MAALCRVCAASTVRISSLSSLVSTRAPYSQALNFEGILYQVQTIVLLKIYVKPSIPFKTHTQAWIILTENMFVLK